MTAYAGHCTRIYGPRSSVAHLSEPGWPGGKPLCPAPEPRGGWLGTGSQDEYERAASLPLCKHCTREAAARDPQTSPVELPGPGLPDAAPGDAAEAPQDPEPRRGPAGPAAQEAPAGGASPALCGTDVPSARPQVLEPLPAADSRRPASKGLFRAVLDRFRS